MIVNTEQSYLLGSSPSTRHSGSGGSPPRASLSQLAAERLGSLKWLMARDLTVSPPGRAVPRATAGTPGTRLEGNARGPARRGYVRRASSADVDSAVATESRSHSGGSGSGTTTPFTPERRGAHFERAKSHHSSGGSTSAGGRRTAAKAAYRLSIDLERAPMGSSVWVKSRRSSAAAAATAAAAAAQDGTVTPGRRATDAQRRRDRSGGVSSDGAEGYSSRGSLVDDRDFESINWRRFWATGGVTVGSLWAVASVLVVGGVIGIAAGCVLALLVTAAVLHYVRTGQAFCCGGEREDDDWLGQLEEEGFDFPGGGEDGFGSKGTATMTI